MNSPKNYVIAFFALTTTALAVMAWIQYQDLISLRGTILDSETQRAAWQKKLRDAQKRSTELESKVTALEKAEPRPPDGPPDDAGGPPRGRGGMRGAFFAAMENPQIQRLMQIQQKAGLDQQYAKLFKSLALTPEQLDKFKNLLVEKRTAMMDVLAAAREQGINPRSDPQAFQKLVSDAQSAVDDSIRSTIGDAGFSQYQNYEKTLPERNTVATVATSLSYTSTPLTDDQQERLTAILAANAPPSRSSNPLPIGFGPGGGTGGTARINDTDIAQAAGVLSADQLAALRELQQQQQAQAELRRQWQNLNNPSSGSGTRATTGGSPPPPPPRPGGG